MVTGIQVLFPGVATLGTIMLRVLEVVKNG